MGVADAPSGIFRLTGNPVYGSLLGLSNCGPFVAFERLVRAGRKERRANPADQGRKSDPRTQKNNERSQYVIENTGRPSKNEAKTNPKRTSLEPPVCIFDPKSEPSSATGVQAAGRSQRNTPRTEIDPRGETRRIASKHKNSGNEAKKSLKTKGLTF
jgi:hypothetical protein